MKKVRIYTIKECGFCNKIKRLFNESNIEFEEIDCDLPENNDKFYELYEVTKSYNVPTIIVDKDILVPKISFKTIEDGFRLVNSLLENK